MEELASTGFLLLDSLPFAMKYQTQQRKSKKYLQLITSCINSYMLPQINTPELTYHPDVRIAFGYNINGQRIIEALPEGIHIKSIDKTIPLDSSQITTSGAGFMPDKNKLRKVFGL